jgi:hypothetical protein
MDKQSDLLSNYVAKAVINNSVINISPDAEKFGFPIFWLWAYSMKVMQAHYIWYLNFYYYH